jgi:hypothetical protein
MVNPLPQAIAKGASRRDSRGSDSLR